MSQERSQMQKFLIVMGLALGLPSTMIGLFFLLHQLVQNGYISWNALLIIMVLVVVSVLGTMVKHVLVKKDRQ